MEVEKAPVKKIFLIDDDPDDRFIFESLLQEVDATIEFSSNAGSESVLEEIKTFLPHLIFLDINIPLKNGFEWLKEFKDHPDIKRIPVVMYSSSDYGNDINASYGLGASLYVQKPVTPERLFNTLRSIIDMSWHIPQDITAKHFRSGTYIAFEAE